jgi:hypothetical protein
VGVCMLCACDSEECEKTSPPPPLLLLSSSSSRALHVACLSFGQISELVSCLAVMFVASAGVCQLKHRFTEAWLYRLQA